MLCPPPPTLNPVIIFEAARLPHRANPSRAAGSFFGQLRSFADPPLRCSRRVRRAPSTATSEWSLRHDADEPVTCRPVRFLTYFRVSMAV